MLQPSQIKDVSERYPDQIAEVRHFIAGAGIPVSAADTLSVLAARLRDDRAFRRDLKLHVWALIGASTQQVSYADLLGILATAAAGPASAAAAYDEDAHALLRFLMDAKSAFDGAPHAAAMPVTPILVTPVPVTRNIVQPAPDVRVIPAAFTRTPEDDDEEDVPTFDMSTDGGNRKTILWLTAAACTLLALGTGLWVHHTAAVDRSHLTMSNAPADVQAPAPILSANAPQPRTQVLPARSLSGNRPAPRMAATTASHESPHASTPTNNVYAPSNAATRPAPIQQAARKPSPAVEVASAPAAAAAPSPSPSPGLLHRPAPPSASNFAAASAPPPSPRDSNLSATHHAGYVRSTSLGTMAANVLYSPAPAYPSAASSLHVQGEVKLEAEVDRDGNVISTRVISGPPLLQEAATDAVQRWHYRPYMHEGKPIATNATVVMDFELPSL